MMGGDGVRFGKGYWNSKRSVQLIYIYIYHESLLCYYGLGRIDDCISSQNVYWRRSDNVSTSYLIYTVYTVQCTLMYNCTVYNVHYILYTLHLKYVRQRDDSTPVEQQYRSDSLDCVFTVRRTSYSCIEIVHYVRRTLYTIFNVHFQRPFSYFLFLF